MCIPSILHTAESTDSSKSKIYGLNTSYQLKEQIHRKGYSDFRYSKQSIKNSYTEVSVQSTVERERFLVGICDS